MNHQEIVAGKRSLHLKPDPGEYGIELKRKAEAGEEKTKPHTVTENVEQEKKGFLTEAEQKALSTAPNDKKRAEQTALIIIRGLGTDNIDEGKRKGNLIRLKLKDNRKRTAKLSDLEFGIIRSCESSKAGGKQEIVLQTSTSKEAYDVFDGLCRKASIMTSAMWVWGLILGILSGFLAFLIGGAGAAVAVGLGVLIVGTAVLSLVHRIAPVYAAVIGIFFVIAGGGIPYAVGVFFGYWMIFGLIELGVRGVIRNA